MVLKAAVVGTGKLGALHAAAYAAHPGVHLVAVCNRSRESAEAVAADYRVPVFNSVVDMLRHVSLDVCSVATSGEENGGAHYEPTMALLESGVAVLCEKPLSNRLNEAERMVALARSRNVPLAVNFNHRFTPAAEQAKEWIRSGKLGAIEMINMRLWIDNPVNSSPYYHLRALHPHSVDLLQYLIGDIRKVAALLKQGADRRIWSHMQALLQFANGSIGQLTGSYDAGESYGLGCTDVIGSKGRLVLDEVYKRLAFYPRKGCEIVSYCHPGGIDGFEQTISRRIRIWIDQLLAGNGCSQVEGSGIEALKGLRVIEAMIQSFETGQFVDVPINSV